jgi:hypothetical protein
MWFFRYGKGMVGIPLEGSTFTCDFREFAEHYGIPWYHMLNEHIFYKPAGSLQSMPWDCFFFRTKAIEYYKECFSKKRLGSFPLFPGTDLPIVPPHWNAWKKVGSKFLKEHELGLNNPEIWLELPALGLHLYPYGKAYRFDVHYTNVARRYYRVPKVVIGYYINDALKAWSVYKYLTVYQIRGSQLQSYLEQGAST